MIRIGITGQMATGKTTLTNALANYVRGIGLSVMILSVDDIRRKIISDNNDLCTELMDTFGIDDINDKTKSIFTSTSDNTNKYNAILKPYIESALWDAIKNCATDVLLLEWARLVEDEMSPLVNNNLIITNCDTNIQMQRLQPSDITDAEITNRINFQTDWTRHKEKLNSINAFFCDTAKPIDIQNIWEHFYEV